MPNFWKKKPALGVGIGVGLIGTLAIALRHRMQRAMREPIPETISPAIFATRVVQTSVGEIVYHTSGAGQPLVFLHGIYPGASSFEWARVYPGFAMGHEVIAPDLIGFGESERPRVGLDGDEHAQSLADLIQSLLGSRRPILVASGVGCTIAIKLAVRHPDLVRELILFAPVGLDATLRRLPVWLTTLGRTPGLNVFVYKNYFARKPFFRGWLAQFGFVQPERITDEVVHMLSTCASQYGAEHAMLAFLRNRYLYDVRAQLPRVVQPVTVLWPSASDRFTPEFPESQRAAIRNCRVVSAGAIGPLGALEDPERLEALIDEAIDAAAFGAA